jgi:hypothetical protein
MAKCAIGGEAGRNAGHVFAEIADQPMIEGHYRDLALVVFQLRADRFDKTFVVAGDALQFDHQGHLAAYEVEQFSKRRHMVPGAADL